MAMCCLAHTALHYQHVGAGPDVVLLHHGTGSVRSWRKQAPVLAAEGYRVMAYDRPGFGQSQWLAAWPLDYLDRDVDDLINLLDVLGIGCATLVGHSDGAAIALLAAARHPDRVAGVVAEAPHVAVEVPRCPEAIRAFTASLAGSPDLLTSLDRNHDGRGRQVVQRWHDRWCDPVFWSWDVSAELALVHCPVLVVHGAEDPYFSVAHSTMIALRARGKLVILPGVGHSPHIEAPEQFAPLLSDFLRNHKDFGSAGSVNGP
jgi:pimeloyl-ACP methyl ester carboxylesterase